MVIEVIQEEQPQPILEDMPTVDQEEEVNVMDAKQQLEMELRAIGDGNSSSTTQLKGKLLNNEFIC